MAGLKQLKREMGFIEYRTQGKRVVEVDLHVLESLAFMHREKLAGRCPPLDDGVSVYNPTGRSIFDRHKPKPTMPKTTRRNPAGPPWKS